MAAGHCYALLAPSWVATRCPTNLGQGLCLPTVSRGKRLPRPLSPLLEAPLQPDGTPLQASVLSNVS